MVDIGQTMRFVPHFLTNQKEDEAQKRKSMITGKVIAVNSQHKHFTVEFNCGGTMQKETFQSFDIGKDIHFAGGARHGR